MAAGFDKKAATKKASPFLAGLAWRIEKIKSLFRGFKPLVTRESVVIAGRQSCYSNRKMLDALPGFTFRSLEDSISEACKQYFEYESLKPKA